MEEMSKVLMIAGVIAAAIIIRLIAGMFDKAGIEHYIESRDGKVDSITWRFFGPGFLNGRGRIYEVVYSDADGNRHNAFCKTSLLSGEYWTEDKIIERKEGAIQSNLEESDLHLLQSENERLKIEIEKLKKNRNHQMES